MEGNRGRESLAGEVYPYAFDADAKDSRPPEVAMGMTHTPSTGPTQNGNDDLSRFDVRGSGVIGE